MLMHITEKNTESFGATRKIIYMHRYSALPYIRTEIPRKDGRCPICIRVRINGEAKPLPVDEYILPKHWNKANRRVKLPPGEIMKECDINDNITLKLEKIERIFRMAYMAFSKTWRNRKTDRRSTKKI